MTGNSASGGVEWHRIDFPGGTGTVALDISAAGEIVGSYNDVSGTHGFRRSPSGEFVSIDVPRSNFTGVAGINSDGDMGTHAPANHVSTTAESIPAARSSARIARSRPAKATPRASCSP